jgi:pantetheine-phosphate adenylyltransferase
MVPRFDILMGELENPVCRVEDILKDFQFVFRRVFGDMGLSDNTLKAIGKCWRQKFRYYHGEKHLKEMLYAILNDYKDREWDGDRLVDNDADYEFRALVITAIFHDVFYEPTETAENEKRSSAYLSQVAERRVGDSGLIREVRSTILDTQYKVPLKNPLSKLFFQYDTLNIRPSLPSLLEWERGIYREWQRYTWAKYRQGRLDFLEKWGVRYPEHQVPCSMLSEYLRAYSPSVGLYAGSFNPFHRGHLDILRQAEQQFDKVIIAVGNNKSKKADPGTAFAELKSLLCYHDVRQFDCLLPEYISYLEADGASPEEGLPGQNVTLIRGIRQDTDLREERIRIYAMQRVKPDLKTSIILCRHEHEIVSSSLIREIESFGKHAADYRVTSEQVYDLI